MLKILLAKQARFAALLSGLVFAMIAGMASPVVFTYPQGQATQCSVLNIATSGAITCTPVATGQSPVFTISSPLTPNPCYALAITSAGAVSCTTALPQCVLTASPVSEPQGTTITLSASDCTQSPSSFSWTGGSITSSTTTASSNTAILPPDAEPGPYPYSVTASNAAGAGAIAEVIVNIAVPGYRGPYAYIAHTASGAASGTLSVIDTTAELALSIFKQLAVGVAPVGVAVNPAGSRVYVTNSGSNSISVIETGKHNIVQVADPSNIGSTLPYIDLGAGKTPWGIAVSGSGEKVYVANSGDNSISVIDAANNTVTASNVSSGGLRPYGIAVNPQKPRLYVTNYDDNSVGVIDTDTNSFLALVNTGSYSFNKPYGVAVDPAGNYVYVVNRGDGVTPGTVSVFNTTYNSVDLAVTVGIAPTGIAVNPAGSKVYVVNSGENTISAIDTANNFAVTTSIASGGLLSEYVAFNPAGTVAYVTHLDSGDISVIDTASGNMVDVAPTDTAVSTIPTRNEPYALGNFVGPAISTVMSESVTAYEYYHAGLNHYFMTANQDEANALDAAANAQTWQRTGKTWSVWKSSVSSLSPVCRFFGTNKYDGNHTRIGPNSHFYTADSAECDFVKTGYMTLANDGILPLTQDGQLYPVWSFEENAFYAQVTAGICPSGTKPIYRLYNNGLGGEPNHRYYTDMAVRTAMLAEGWVAEPSNGNPVMCGPPE